jgi:hypothetical protein
MLIRVFLLLIVLNLPLNSQAQSPGGSLEKFTGAWCGWCPYGAWVLDSIQERLGDQAVILAWHFDDKLEIKAHDTLAMKISNGGHPVVSVARKPVISNTQLDWSESHPWYLKTLERFLIDPPANAELNNVIYDANSRGLVFMPTLSPVVSEWPKTGVPMSVAILTEDEVILDQTLYDKSGAQLPKLEDYRHKNVVRQVAGKVLGDSMNYAFGAGWYFLPYQMTVDPKWDASKTRLNVLFLVRNEDGSYTSLGAIRTRYLTELSTADVKKDEKIDIAIYPNPAREKIMIALPVHREATIDMFNVFGQRVDSYLLDTGKSIDVSQLPRGPYHVVVNLDGTVIHHTLVLQ